MSLTTSLKWFCFRLFACLSVISLFLLTSQFISAQNVLIKPINMTIQNQEKEIKSQIEAVVPSLSGEEATNIIQVDGEVEKNQNILTFTKYYQIQTDAYR